MLYKQAMEKLSGKGNDQKLRVGWWSKISFRNLRKLVGARSSSSFYGIVRSSVVSDLQCTDRTLRTRRLFFHWKTQKHWTLLLSQLRAPWTPAIKKDPAADPVIIALETLSLRTEHILLFAQVYFLQDFKTAEHIGENDRMLMMDVT